MKITKSMIRCLALLCMVAMTGSAQAQSFEYDYRKDTVEVTENEYHLFEKVPWKCVLVMDEGDTIRQMWFDRDGILKAEGMKPDANGCFWLHTYVRKGEEMFSSYKTEAKLNANGELKTKHSPLHLNMWKASPQRYTNAPDRLKHNTTTHIDKHGNWFIGFDWRHEGMWRKLYYFEDAFDAEEDAWLDEVAAAAMKEVDAKQEFRNSSSLLIYGKMLQGLMFTLVLYVIALIFFRRKVYAVIDSWAQAHITPRGFFSRSMLLGLLPFSLFVLPMYCAFGNGVLDEINWPTSYLMPWTFFAGVVLSIVGCLVLIAIKARTMPRRLATSIVLFGFWSDLAVLGAVYLMVMMVILFILVVVGIFFVQTGVAALFGGAAAGGASAIGGAAGAAAGMADTGGADNDFEPMLDPYNGDDGGILDGTSRIPLRDNNDGTMTDNNGHLYKRDGNHVRRVL